MTISSFPVCIRLHLDRSLTFYSHSHTPKCKHNNWIALFKLISSIFFATKINNQNKHIGNKTKTKSMTFLFFYWAKLTFGGRELKFDGEGWMSKFLVGVGSPPSPQYGKPCINFANRFLYTMKKLRAHHMHHVSKSPSYFCKISALCVPQRQMVYIVTCLFSVCNTSLSHHDHV